MKRNRISNFLKLDARGVELARGSLGGFAVRILSLAVVFAFHVALTRLLGAEQAGIYYLGVAIISAVAVFSLFGIDNGSVRHAANLFAEQKWYALRYLFVRAVGFVTLSAVVWAVLLLLTASLVSTHVFGKAELVFPLRVMSFAVPFLALTFLTSRFLQSAKRAALALFFQNAASPAVFGTCLLLLPVAWELKSAAVFYPLSVFAAYLGCLLVWLRFVPAHSENQDVYDVGAVVRSGMTLFPANIVNKVIRPWTGVLLLGIWGSATDVAWFASATRLAALISFAVLPVNTILAPQVAILAKQGDMRAVFGQATRATLIILLVAVPCLIPVLLAPNWVMSVFGPDFVAAGSVLLILALGQLINVLTGPVQSILVMTGNESNHRAASLVGGITSIVLCLALIPKWGSTGAAWATTAAVATTNITSAAMVWALWRASDSGAR